MPENTTPASTHVSAPEASTPASTLEAPLVASEFSSKDLAEFISLRWADPWGTSYALTGWGRSGWAPSASGEAAVLVKLI